MRKNIKIFLNYFLGPVLLLLLAYSMYHQVLRQPDLPQRWQQIKLSWRLPLFWLAVALSAVNWGLEARKWQLLIKPLEPFSFWRSYKSVLAGCSITMLTPNRVGEYGGRILFVSEQNRIAAIPLNMLGSLSQLFVTIIMGTAGLFIFRFFSTESHALYSLLPTIAGQIFLYGCLLLSVLLLLFYLRAGFIIKALLYIPYLKKYVKYLHFLYEFSRKQLLRILYLSFLRYLVFILQYMLLLQVMQVGIEVFNAFWLLTVFYLVITLAPTIGFTELPLRAAASVEIFQVFSNNVLGIQAASLSIWMINLAMPAIAGSLMILTVKILKEKDE